VKSDVGDGEEELIYTVYGYAKKDQKVFLFIIIIKLKIVLCI